jgi:hypothetical protein
MDEAIEKEIEHINALADKLLAIVMNTDMENPEVGIAALGHVAAMISVELKMPEEAFLMCMMASYQTIVQANKDIEVH